MEDGREDVKEDGAKDSEISLNITANLPQGNLTAEHLAGIAVRVRFERRQGETFLVFAENNPTNGLEKQEHQMPTTETIGTFDEQNSDTASVWSARTPTPKSKTLINWVSWLFVAFFGLCYIGYFLTITLQDLSFGWTVSYFVFQIFENDLTLLILPFLFCMSPTPWPLIALYFELILACVGNILSYELVTIWQGYLSSDSIIVICICLVTLVFSFRLHRFLSTKRRRGQFLELWSTLIRYYLLLSGAEMIRIISLLRAGVEPSFILSYNRYSAVFCYPAAMLMLLMRVKFSEHPEATNFSELFAAFSPREFVPFVVITLHFLIFLIAYISGLSGGQVAIQIFYFFYLLFVIEIIQVLALSTKLVWLRWVV